MIFTRKSASVFYGLVALLAFIGTWGNNIQYLSLGFVGANLQFWQETLVNPASRSITVDVMFLFLAVSVWMFLEARRVGMKGAWLYVIFGVLIAISVTFPLFMLNRERALSKLDGVSSATGKLNGIEIAILVFIAFIACAYTFMTLTR
jgi:hypothetical protein